ncbi:MAG: PAS domain S-box protein, partial [Psychromonas sp.]
MFEVITSTSYWVLTVLCGAILWLCIGPFRQSQNTDKTVVVLLFILAIDAFRTLVESVYFGLYFNSMFGLLPAGIYNLLANPHLLIIPKLVNIIAGFLVLVLLIRYWMPRALRERAQQIDDLERAKFTAEKKMLEFESIFNSIPDAIVLTDLDRRITVVNSGLERIFGYTFNDLVGKTTAVLYEDNAEYERLGRVRFNMSAKENNDTYEVNCRRKNGQVFIGESLGTAVRGENGSILGFIGVMRDITQRKHNEDRLKLAASVFTHAREGIMVTDTDGTIIEVNDTFSLITGYDREEVLGNNPRLLKSGRQSPTFYVGLWNSLIENKHWSGELWNQHKNGEVYAVLTTISALCDAHGQAQHYVALFLEITDIKMQEQKLEQISHYDALTGLPNRVLLADRLRHAMNQCQRRGKSLVVA